MACVVMNALPADIKIASAPRSMQGVVPQTWTWAFLPQGSSRNMV